MRTELTSCKSVLHFTSLEFILRQTFPRRTLRLGNAELRHLGEFVNDLVNELNIPAISAHGMNESHFPGAVQKTLNANSYKGNPIALNERDLKAILEKASQ